MLKVTASNSKLTNWLSTINLGRGFIVGVLATLFMLLFGLLLIALMKDSS